MREFKVKDLLIFDILLLLILGCSDNNETPAPKLIADFNSNVTSIKQGESVSFTDNSKGEIDNYEWTFEGGIPTISKEQNPVITYKDDGKFSVTLKIVNKFTMDTEVKTDFISVEAVEINALFSSDETSIRPSESIAFTNESIGEDLAFEWTFEGGTPASSTEQNPVIKYNEEGVFSVNLKIVNEFTEDTEVKSGYISVARSSENALFDLSFQANLNSQIISNINTIISGNNVSGIIPYGAGFQLIPTFQVSDFATVKINDAEVTSGESLIDFSSEISMTVTAENGDENVYQIDISDIISSIDNIMQAKIDQWGITGLSLAITKDEKLVYARPFGLASIEDNESVTIESLFRIGSISKLVTDVTLIKLNENGQLDFESKVFGSSGILGNEYGEITDANPISEITVRHLMDHKSGWTNSPNDITTFDNSYSREDLLEYLLNQRTLTYSPGTTYYYFNMGFIILHLVIEKVTSESYEAYVKDNILSPINILEMKGGKNTLGEKYANEVTYYNDQFSPYLVDIERGIATGGWIASSSDLVNLAVHIDGNTTKADIISSGFGGNWTFFGGLPGTVSVLSKTGDFTFSIIVNNDDPAMNEDLRAALEDAIYKVTEWPQYDLFD